MLEKKELAACALETVRKLNTKHTHRRFSAGSFMLNGWADRDAAEAALAELSEQGVLEKTLEIHCPNGHMVWGALPEAEFTSNMLTFRCMECEDEDFDGEENTVSNVYLLKKDFPRGSPEIAEKLFDAYNAFGPTPWKTFDGRDVPKWDALNDAVREKWMAAADKARKIFKKEE